MTQPSFIDTSVKSRAAADKHDGKAKTHAEMIVAALRKYPGPTSKELCRVVDLERHEIARRTSDLERAKRIVGLREQGKQIIWRVVQ